MAIDPNIALGVRSVEFQNPKTPKPQNPKFQSLKFLVREFMIL